MKDYSYIYNAHPSFIEKMYRQYQQNPDKVDAGWRTFFEGFEFAGSPQGDESSGEYLSGNVTKEFGVLSLIYGFRTRGHLISDTNPIRKRKDRRAHLNLQDHDLDENDMDQVFVAGKEIGLENATLRQILDKLYKIYAGSIGVEFAHIENREKRTWLRSKIESMNTHGDYGLSLEKKKRILSKLNGAVMFEKFLHTKYVGQKRFSLEGGETTIAALDAVISTAASNRVEEVLIGMAHRGRLNVLANIMGKTYEHIFNEFEGTAIPDMSYGDGDVKYHLGYSSQVKTIEGKKVDLKLAPNPSHLESVDPVLEGFTRAKADILYEGDYDRVLPILIHGDAAVAGQGVVYETVQMSQLDGYYTGGTLHFIINNQVGFTTDFEDARSSTYSTAAASLVQAPVFHVNGDDPEAVIWAAELAIEYRQKFNNDVFVDMVCYRKHGHNEGDDPKFTQPQMYESISKHKNPREIYVERLIERGDVDAELASQMEKEFWGDLQKRLDLVKQKSLPYTYQEPERAWKKLKKNAKITDLKSVKTSITKKSVDTIVDKLINLPEGFNALSKVARLQKSSRKLIDNKKIDWAFGELIAYGSILLEGKNVRMSGQDVKRGTFSHRHAVLRDAKTYEEYNRLSNVGVGQGEYMIYNSLLSEFAVLGFEYGYSLASPDSLVIWEAQFGDFYNGAQTIVDQYISAAESKWQRMSGLVMLLPHGYAGQGPEHSSARVERFLQSCADFNMIVANITTPANFFHLLRRQLALPFRKPLVVMSPKSLLRHPKCVSDISELIGKNTFVETIDDVDAVASKVKRLILCTGKIYYDLLEKKEKDNRTDIAIARIEQLHPFPEEAVQKMLAKYKKGDVVWVQEEPANMGYWDYILRYLRRTPIELIARPASASPATGFKKVHDDQQAEIINMAFKL
ncbi:MAG: 2-oxoglutarate dehydrogenase E1 component [Saprospiraceae bacterium]|nr:2-oxoglutarate dehydrogenase E1 component [Saprospiraceae bacterium]